MVLEEWRKLKYLNRWINQETREVIAVQKHLYQWHNEKFYRGRHIYIVSYNSGPSFEGPKLVVMFEGLNKFEAIAFAKRYMEQH